MEEIKLFVSCHQPAPVPSSKKAPRFSRRDPANCSAPGSVYGTAQQQSFDRPHGHWDSKDTQSSLLLQKRTAFKTRARSAAHFAALSSSFSKRIVGDFVKIESPSPVFSRDRDSKRLYLQYGGILSVWPLVPQIFVFESPQGHHSIYRKVQLSPVRQ